MALLPAAYHVWLARCPRLVIWGVLLVAHSLSLQAVVAQVPTTTPWLPDSVLSTLVVRAMAADDQGYLWVGTTEGLRRYDGYQTVPLPQLLTSSKIAPPRGYIHALTRDDDGRLWVGGTDGLYCWIPGTSTLTRLPLPLNAANGSETDLVYVLWIDPRTHLLWVGYSTGRVLVLDPAHPATRALLPPSLLEQPSHFAAAPGGDVWLTTHNGQLHLLSAQGQRRQQYAKAGVYLLPVPGTQHFVSSQALYTLDVRTGAFRERLRWLPASASESETFQPALDAFGRPVQWLIQQQRLVLQWSQADKLPQVKQLAIAFDATEPSTQYTLFQDARRLWWAFSPEARGCYKGGTAVPLRQLPVAGQARPPSVRGLTQLPDKRFLMSSYNGVFVQPAGRPTAPLQPLLLTREGRPWPALLYDVLVSATGRLLFADEVDTFGELNSQTGALTYYPLYPLTAVPPQVHGLTVYQARMGAVWGGATDGLYELDEVGRRITRYSTPAGTSPLQNRAVRSISEDSAGTLWLATNRGLYALTPATGALQHYGATEPAPARHLPTDDLLCVYAQPKGSVWVGTATHGLLRVVAGRGQVGQVGTGQGLPSSTVATVLPGAAGELWAGTYAGLVCYRPATGQLTIYGPAEGLANPELNKQAAYRAADGTLFFGGVGGVFRVEAGATLVGADRPPRLLLTAQAGSSGTPRFLLTPEAVPTLTLDKSSNEGGFDLAINDYRAPTLSRFFYQLQSADAPVGAKAMVQPTSRRLRLHDLGAGTYEVLVWGQTPAGQRTTSQRLRVVVARPWWQHPLVLLGGVGLLLGASVGVQQLRIRRLKREAQLRTRIAADLHDEVGALLTRVNLRAELLQEPSAPDEITADIQALLLDSRAALMMMRDVVWSIDAGSDTVGALRDRLHDHLDATAKAAGLHATLTVHDLPDATSLSPQLRQHLYLIAKEAITNTVRHAPDATCLELTLLRQGTTLLFLIHNNGAVAPAPASQQQGMGLRNMQRRAQALGGQLTSQPDAAGGWTVRVQVPF